MNNPLRPRALRFNWTDTGKYRVAFVLLNLALAVISSPVIAASPHDRSPGVGAVVGLYQSQQNQTVATKNAGITSDNQRGSESSPVFIKPLHTDKTQEEAADDARERDAKNFDVKVDHVIGGAGVLLTLGTLVVIVTQTRAFFDQARRLKETIDTMRELANSQAADTARSIVQTEKLAIAAQASAQIATRSLIAGNRARLSVDPVISHQPLTIDENGAYTLFAARVRNYGNAPAVDVRLGIKLVTARPDNPIGPSIDLDEFLKHGRRWFSIKKTLEPSNTYSESPAFNISISRQDIEQCAIHHGNGKNFVLFLIGGVDYTFDVDPSSRYQQSFIRQLELTSRAPFTLENASFGPSLLILTLPPMVG